MNKNKKLIKYKALTKKIVLKPLIFKKFLYYEKNYIN